MGVQSRGGSGPLQEATNFARILREVNPYGFMLGAKTTRTLARRSIMEALPQGKERRLVLRLL